MGDRRNNQKQRPGVDPQPGSQCRDSACFSSVQFSHSVMSDSATPWITAHQASLSITNSRSSLKLTSIESDVQPSHPLLSPSPSAPNPSQHQSLFQWVNSLHEWSQESSPTPQFKSINSSLLSLFCSPTLTDIHDYRKSKYLTIWSFVDKEMSLLFNMFVIAFLPRSKHRLISWLQSPSSMFMFPILSLKIINCMLCISFI